MPRNPKITDPAFYRSDVQQVLITTTTHAGEVNLNQNWAFPVVVIPSCQGVPSSTTLSITVAYDDADALVPLYTKDTGAIWSKSLPTSGGIAFILTDAAFAQKLKFTLSNAWVNPGNWAGLAIRVYGFEKGYG